MFGATKAKAGDTWSELKGKIGGETLEDLRDRAQQLKDDADALLDQLQSARPDLKLELPFGSRRKQTDFGYVVPFAGLLVTVGTLLIGAFVFQKQLIALFSSQKRVPELPIDASRAMQPLGDIAAKAASLRDRAGATLHREVPSEVSDALNTDAS